MPRMSRLRLVLSISCALATAARADKPRLVIVPFATGEGASDAATSKFLGLLTEQLKSRGDAVELVAPPVTRAAPDKATGKRGPSAEAAQAMQTGRKAFDELRFDEAIPELKRGVELMLQDAATADFEQIQDALVKVAASYFRSGEEKEAKASLTELARLAPGFTLPPGFPPVFQREFEKALKRVDKQPRGQVSVEGPSGATAFLDGRDLGMVPVTEEGVSGGLHYVRVEGTRGERFGQQLDVKGGPVKVKAAFGAAPERAPVNVVPNPNVTAVVDEGMAQRLTAYCKAAGADFALIGLVYRTSDAQLSAGTALFSARRAALAPLGSTAFDVEVLTANTEAFKLADDVLARTAAFGAPGTPPFSLQVTKAQPVATATKTPPARGEVDPDSDQLTVAAPERKRPRASVEPSPRVFARPSNLVDPEEVPEKALAEKPGVKPATPAWVWVVVSVVAVGGLAAGGYFGVREVTRPVTGTVNASW